MRVYIAIIANILTQDKDRVQEGRQNVDGFGYDEVAKDSHVSNNGR
jgi:hypothetical protein